ncbi:MAG: DUF2313 domain-containing protein [Chloroflexi bacterium]|nr:MAG: DUF2313 domain-containing protein [Chloroflexota bacterium]
MATIKTTQTPVTKSPWNGDPPAQAGAVQQTGQKISPVVVSHVTDFCRRYPGEQVTFFTQVEFLKAQSNLTLRVSMPNGLELGEYHADPKLNGLLPYVEIEKNARYLVWFLEGNLPAGSSFEFQAEARVGPAQLKINFESQAVVTNSAHHILTQEYATVNVEPKGGYLRYLPELYEQDEFMGRFLMLFESFWSPIDTQIDSIANYFDPRLTPARFLPWLASWLDLELDESWPEEGVRQLIRWAIALHRSRGTRWGLLKYLELYTGQTAEIVEQRAENFILGADSRLGPGIALGHGNVPHTFTVTLRLPPVQASTKQEQKRLEDVRRQTIEAIIERQKPAHTVYTLHLEPLNVNNELAEPAKPAQPVVKKDNEIAAQAAIWFKLDD